MQIFENALGKSVAGSLPPPAAPAPLARPVHGVADFCINEGYVQKEFMKKILGWRYTGFSVYMETRIDYKKSDEESDKKLRQLIHATLNRQ